jgi:tetratricopeptide (TPR) repeat protein
MAEARGGQCGPETFGMALTSVFPPELVYVQGRAVLVDRAHNLILDTLAATGILGLLTSGALVGSVFVIGMRRLSTSRDPWARFALTSALAAATGHLVETQLSFQTTTTAALFWLMLAVLVALFPGSAMLHTGWGLLYVTQHRLADAEAQFHHAVGLDHTDFTAFRYLGDVQLAQGDLAGAEHSNSEALRWARGMAEAYQGLGHVYRQGGRLELALSTFQHALELSPGNPEAYVDVARCAWDLGQRELACQTDQRGLLLAPDHPGLLDLWAACGR